MGAPAVLEAAGIMPADDPAWESTRTFVANQQSYAEAVSSFWEDGGIYSSAFCHGNLQLGNVFFPFSREGKPSMTESSGNAVVFIGYERMKRLTPTFDAMFFIVISE